MKYLLFFGYMISVLCLGNAQSFVQYDKNGISIEYPSSWKINDKQSDYIKLMISTELHDESDNFSDNVNIMVQPLPRLNYSIEEYTEDTKKQLSATEAEVFNVRVENHYTDNGISTKAIYNYAMKFGSYNLRFYQQAQIINGKIYLLTFTSEVDSYSLYIDAARSIINSFKLSERSLISSMINNDFSIDNLDGFEPIALEGDYVLHMGYFSDNNFSSYSVKQNRSEYFKGLESSDLATLLSEEQIINSIKILYKDIDINVFSRDFPLYNGIVNVSHLVYTGVEKESGVNMTISIFQFLKGDSLYTLNCQCRSTHFQYFYKQCLNLANSIEFR